jgi:hypothetical protein
MAFNFINNKVMLDAMLNIKNLYCKVSTFKVLLVNSSFNKIYYIKKYPNTISL